MDRAIPIIVVHRGNQDYLLYCLKQAHCCNPDSAIILLGDETNVDMPKFVKHYNIDDYMGSADKFSPHYLHLSSNPYQYELLCINRWFIISDFIKKHKIEKFFHIDSDVLLFCNVTREAEFLKNYKMAITGISGHTSYWASHNVLDDFCSYVWELYRTECGRKKLLEMNNVFIEKGQECGVSDMTLLTDYKMQHKESVFDLGRIYSGRVWDTCISFFGLGRYYLEEDVSDERFEMKRGHKRIFFESGQPFCKKVSGEKVKFNSLHFQGDSKIHMHRIYKSNKFVKVKNKKDFIIRNNVLRPLIWKIADMLNYRDERFLAKYKNKLLKICGLKIGKNTLISKGLECIIPENVVIERNVAIGYNCILSSYCKIKIGQFVQMARDVSIMAGSHYNDNFAPLPEQNIEIGAGCWIGTRVTILGGVKIGKGCIIGAGALVNKSLPDFSIAVGVPAKVIKMREPADVIIHPAREYTLEELEIM